MAKLKKYKVSGSKKLKTPPSVSVNYDRSKPKFSLEYLQRDYCLSHCQQEEKASFADAIHKRSQLTWSQINSLPRHGLGYEIIPQHQINSGLPNHLSKEVNLLSFRCFGIKPMVGYRKNDTFYVLWLDRNHDLYT